MPVMRTAKDKRKSATKTTGDADHDVAEARDCRLQRKVGIVAPTLPENVHNLFSPIIFYVACYWG